MGVFCSEARGWVPALLVWLCAAAGTLAGGPGHTAFLPGDIGVYVEARGMRATDWDVLAPLLGELEEIDRSWAELAARMEMTPEDAFARLLGERTSIAIRGAWTGETDWAVLLSTDTDTAAYLRAKLGAAPRKIRGTGTVLGLQGGRFQLAQLTAEGERGVVLALAPRDGRLFDELGSGCEKFLEQG